MLLGRIHQSEGVDSVITGLGDRSKQIREAAHWALRQTLIDDHGWPQVFKAAMTGDDYQREAAIRALVMKVDSELPDSQLDHAQLTSTLNHALNLDPHPAVRAWATRSAWQWWVWNPATRPALNAAWVKLLTRARDERVGGSCLALPKSCIVRCQRACCQWLKTTSIQAPRQNSSPRSGKFVTS